MAAIPGPTALPEVTQDTFQRYLDWYEKGKKQFTPISMAREEIYARLHDPEVRVGRHFPWTTTHNRIGLRKHELSIWAGINGHGKSLAVSQVAAGLCAQGQRVVLCSPELPLAAIGARLARQVLRCNAPGNADLDALWKWLFGRFWVYQPKGVITPERVLAACWFARDEMETDHFIVDSLMKIGIGEDDYNGQKDFVNRLADLARDTGVHVHLVCHIRKGANAHDAVDKFDIKGTGTITDLADNVFILQRNTRKEMLKDKDGLTPAEQKTMDLPDVRFTCDKARHGEWEGSVGLWFIENCQQLVAHKGTEPMHLVPQLTHRQRELA